MTSIIFLCLIFISEVTSYPDGPPSSACTSMVASHGVNAQTGPHNYEVILSKYTYTPRENIRVTLQLKDEAGATFKGFAISIRSDVTDDEAGYFFAGDGKAGCGLRQRHHDESVVKIRQTMEWQAPVRDEGTLIVYATIVEDKETFWYKQRLATIESAFSVSTQNPITVSVPVTLPPTTSTIAPQPTTTRTQVTVTQGPNPTNVVTTTTVSPVYNEFDVRLINNVNGNYWEGVPVVLYGGVWYPLCDDDFATQEAAVICTQLGFLYRNSTLSWRHDGGSLYQSGITGNEFLMSRLACTGTEQRVTDCPMNPPMNFRDDIRFNCWNHEQASVACTPDICSSNPCKNGGNCTQFEDDTTGSFDFTCSCLQTFMGRTCEQDFNECASSNDNNCNSNSKCENLYGSYTCECFPGWSGQFCDQDLNECSLGIDECHDSNAVCVNTVGSYECTCIRTGWIGDHCDIDFNECINTTCGNGATCENNPGSYTCKCPDGFRGASCSEDIDECAEGTDLCSRINGRCENTFGSYTCSCIVAGWTGLYCTEDINECTLGILTCVGGGICRNTEGSYYCECPAGRTGSSCDLDLNECTESGGTLHGCSNGGTCVNMDPYYTCSCTPQWTGQNCTVDVNECLTGDHNCVLNQGNCENFDGGYRCICEDLFDGQFCHLDRNECETGEHKCLNGATCIDQNPLYRCECPAEWRGEFCDEQIVLCGGVECIHGTCLNSVCVCEPGWTDVACDKDLNECAVPGYCMNGGTCTNFEGGYNCDCTPQWTGDSCTIDVDECMIGAHNCTIGQGACKNTEGGFVCECLPFIYWTGQTCAEDLNECASNTHLCENDATCVNVVGAPGYMCNCTSEWQGTYCQQGVNECLTLGPCQNGGLCKDLTPGYECTCTTQWEGTHCTIDIDECASALTHSCVNGGLCKNDAPGYSCLCTPNWQGDFCEQDVNECITGQHNCKLGQGICDNTVGSFECKCDPQWTGPTCEIDVNECEIDGGPCENGGACRNLEPGFVCDCTPFWEGPTCEQDVNECLTNKHECIVNQGICINEQPGYRCECGSFYEGQYCEIAIDPCSLVRCVNGECTSDSNFQTTCTCNSGWQGNECDTDIAECSIPSNCITGYCVELPGSYQCNCLTGYVGVKCDTELDECATGIHGCQKGTCINTPGSYTCDCDDGWKGTLCDTPLISLKLSNGNDGYVLIWKNGVWGLICADDWGQEDADVVCNTLGFSEAKVQTSNLYSNKHRNFIHLQTSNCLGTEMDFDDCDNTFFRLSQATSFTCPSWSVAGAQCYNPTSCPSTAAPDAGRLTINSKGYVSRAFYRDANLYLSTHEISPSIKEVACQFWRHEDGDDTYNVTQVGYSSNDQICQTQVIFSKQDSRDEELVESTRHFCQDTDNSQGFYRRQMIMTLKRDGGNWPSYCYLISQGFVIRYDEGIFIGCVPTAWEN